MNRIMFLLTGFFLAALVSTLYADDTYYYVPLTDIIRSEQLDKLAPDPNREEQWGFRVRDMIPYAAGNNQEEIYVVNQRALSTDFGAVMYFDVSDISQCRVAISCKSEHKPSGWVFLPKRDHSRLVGFEFTIKDIPADQNAMREQFFKAKERYYRDLVDRGIPGGAWFRHEMLEARYAYKKREADNVTAAGNNPAMRRAPFSRESEIDRTYDIMSGGRAVSENLQLDRQLRIGSDTAYTIDVNSIQGITTLPVDWKALVKDITPQKDALAAYIPADQHVIFFPSFSDMLKVTDRANDESMPLIAMLGRSEDTQTKIRYDRQLCLSTDALSRLLGPKLVKSMAFTGSDPYLRVGSDVAVLFEAVDPTILMATISARQKSAISKDVQPVKGMIEGIEYTGIISPGRAVCSYLTMINKTVIVTNSLYQLRQIIKVSKGQIPAIASLDEYAFFRNRYKLGDSNETAFLVLSDATIRRWCSPRWRIGDSRRTCVAASLAELQARHLDELVQGGIKPHSIDADIPGTGRTTLMPSGIMSEKYGSLDFMTPIAELQIDKATNSESQAYERFRNNYQYQWRQYFDPIALRIFVDGDKIAFNLTIRPLIMQTEYNQFIEITGGQKLDGFAGDRHSGAIMHAILAVDPNSKIIRQFGSFASQMAPGLTIEPFSWVGRWITIYADDDPFWAKFAKTAQSHSYDMENRLNELPLALQVDVDSPFKLAAFLTTIRGFAEQSAPGMLIWQTANYNGQPFVKVGIDPNQSHGAPNFTICYCATPKSFIITLNESLLKRAIDRTKNIKSASDIAKAQRTKPWLGSSMNIQVKPEGTAILREIFGYSLHDSLEDKSWQNIVILNEWHRRYPNISPVEFHEQFWQTKLVCPGGGKYVWNDQFKTMESTVFGSPSNPQKAAQVANTIFDIRDVDFGLTFESGGLNVSAELIKNKMAQ